MIYRVAKFSSWIKLSIQAIVSIGFGIAYVTLIEAAAHWLTALVLFALGAALFYQARRAKLDPAKSLY